MPPYVESTDRPRRRLGQALRLPTVSGKASAAWLVFCFLLTAAIVPVFIRQPIWIDCEIVVAFWWLIWLVALTRMLYVGWHVTDDHQWSAPRNWFGLGKKKATAEKTKSSSSSGATSESSWSGFDFALDGFEFEGCAIVAGILLAIVLLFFGAWFLIEIALPALTLVLYLTIRGMLAQAVNNGGTCRGRFLQSFGCGLFWATVYTAPVAVAVWLIHVLHRGHLVG